MDQSLDAIIASSRPQGAPRNQRRGGRAGRGARPAPAGPAGVAKKTAAKKVTAAPKVPTGPSSNRAPASRVMISGFPTDVAVRDIEAYINKTAGPTKKVELAYGPNGQSRGSATVTFKNQEVASNAMRLLSNTRIDGRVIKIEAIVDAAAIEAQAQAQIAKSLADRATKPKSAAGAGKAGGRKGAVKEGEKKTESKKGKSGRGGRPKPKTIEELDQEMMDYQAGGGENSNAGTNGGAATNGGEMDIAS